MTNQDLICNPFAGTGFEVEGIGRGGFGAVLGHAGMGKTALLVQLAMSSMIRGTNVLHISLNDPVRKVSLWYEELVNKLTENCEGTVRREIAQSVQQKRFIMTFRVDSFNVPKLEERLADLVVQKIFKPDLMIVDGLQCDERQKDTLSCLKYMAKKDGLTVWFAVHVHRHEGLGEDGLPVSFVPVADLFDFVMELKSTSFGVGVRVLKGETPIAINCMNMDPSTLLIKGPGLLQNDRS